ncbi:MAG: lysophospholipase [Clostridia bacterium]|nr:lysophospholipase [Clostridia bacterium]
MAVIKTEFTLPSTVGDLDLHAISWKPEGEVKAVLQIIHGMAEYIERYDAFATYFAEKGIAVYGLDHIGHGESVNDNYPLGYFGKDNECGKVFRDDAYELTKLAKAENPDKPYILFGHSMGSFVNRMYIAKYADAIDATIICGTAGPNPAILPALALTKVLKATRGKKPGKLMNMMAFGTYNARTPKKTAFDWLSFNEKNVEDYIADPLCGFLFTNSGFRDLITLNNAICQADTFAAVPADLPIYLIAGSEDPVSSYGKGIYQTYESFKKAHSNVEMKLYEGMRHEIHNETDPTEPLADILAFVEKIAQ